MLYVNYISIKKKNLLNLVTDQMWDGRQEKREETKEDLGHRNQTASVSFLTLQFISYANIGKSLCLKFPHL